MIDFRYHLVSLISVFLALAVGIALGAGPLKEAIGDSLTGQVDQLRAEKEDLRTQLDETTAALDVQQEVFAAAAPGLVDDVLAGRRVAVIELADVQAETRDQVSERIGQAGGTVTAVVQVTEQWTDPGRRAYRQSLAGTLVEYLDPVPPTDAGPDVELAEALAQSLTTPLPTDPDVLSPDAAIVLDLLTESGLVTHEGDVDVPADAIVVLAGPSLDPTADPEAETADPTEAAEETPATGEALAARLDAAVQIAIAAQDRSAGAVVAGGEPANPGLLHRLRQDESTRARVSTVESVGTLVGQVSVPLALSARIAGTVGHYGVTGEVTAPIPQRVVLPPIERTPQVPPEQAEDGTGVDGVGAGGAGGEGSGTDGTDGTDPGSTVADETVQTAGG